MISRSATPLKAAGPVRAGAGASAGARLQLLVLVGLNGLVAENWWGAFLPAGTPKAIVDNYHTALVKIMADPDLKEKFAGLGVEAQASTQDEFRAFLKEEITKYAKLVAENGIKGE